MTAPAATYSRREQLEKIQSRQWDICIVGGGINGAGVFRDAVLRGLRVCMIEQRDFASGTSSRSSKLVHGGVRYLEQMQFRLVFESLSERAVWMRNAPHLVQAIPFTFPVYKSTLTFLKIRLGLTLYDLLALFRNPILHQTLSPQQVAQMEPGLRQEGLVGAIVYGDCMTDDARMTLEATLDGVRNGGAALNYCQAGRLHHREGQYVLEAQDLLGGERFEIRTHTVANLTGAWSDVFLKEAITGEHSTTLPHPDPANPQLLKPRLRPTKGVHIQIPSALIGNETSVVMFHPNDRRVLFTIPRGNVTIIGTTDTDFDGDPNEVHCTREDVDYCLDALRYYFPGRKVGYEDVISTYAGLRPLINQEGVHESQVSREHQVTEDLPGVFSMFGGKLTTYRLMAQDFLEVLGERLTKLKHQPFPPPANTAELSTFDGNFHHPPADFLALFPADHALRVWKRYGERGRALAEILAAEPELATLLSPHGPFLAAEVVFSARYEAVSRLEDLLIRRMSFSFFAWEQGLDAAETASRLLGRELGWDEQRRQAEVAAYQAEIAKSRAWQAEGEVATTAR